MTVWIDRMSDAKAAAYGFGSWLASATGLGVSLTLANEVVSLLTGLVSLATGLVAFCIVWRKFKKGGKA